jgi:hypothetical protein
LGNDKEKNRFTLELPDSEDEQLETASRVSGRTKRDLIRTALGVYFTLCVEVHEGARIMIRKSDGQMIQLQI